MPVILDPLHGAALLAERKIPIFAAGNKGELQVFGAEGPVLRPLTFGERMRAMRQASATTQPRDFLAASILHSATIAPGVGEQLVLEIIALKLAGAGLLAPPLHECVALVAQATRWTPAQLYEAEAAEVDQLAAQLGQQRYQSEWNQLLIFNNTEEDLHAIRASLADSLLQRAEGEENEGDFIKEDASLQPGSPHNGYALKAQKPWEKESHLHGNHAAATAHQSAYPQNEEGKNTLAQTEAKTDTAHSASAWQPANYTRFRSQNETQANLAGHALPAEENKANTPMTIHQNREQTLHVPRHSVNLDAGLRRRLSSLMPFLFAKIPAPNFKTRAANAMQDSIDENEALFFTFESMPRAPQEKIEDAVSTSPRFTEPSFRMASEEVLTEWMETLAAWLHAEADLRGVER